MANGIDCAKLARAALEISAKVKGTQETDLPAIGRATAGSGAAGKTNGEVDVAIALLEHRVTDAKAIDAEMRAKGLRPFRFFSTTEEGQPAISRWLSSYFTQVINRVDFRTEGAIQRFKQRGFKEFYGEVLSVWSDWGFGNIKGSAKEATRNAPMFAKAFFKARDNPDMEKPDDVVERLAWSIVKGLRFMQEDAGAYGLAFDVNNRSLPFPIDPTKAKMRGIREFANDMGWTEAEARTHFIRDATTGSDQIMPMNFRAKDPEEWARLHEKYGKPLTAPDLIVWVARMMEQQGNKIAVGSEVGGKKGVNAVHRLLDKVREKDAMPIHSRYEEGLDRRLFRYEHDDTRRTGSSLEDDLKAMQDEAEFFDTVIKKTGGITGRGVAKGLSQISNIGIAAALVNAPRWGIVDPIAVSRTARNLGYPIRSEWLNLVGGELVDGIANFAYGLFRGSAHEQRVAARMFIQSAREARALGGAATISTGAFDGSGLGHNIGQMIRKVTGQTTMNDQMLARQRKNVNERILRGLRDDNPPREWSIQFLEGTVPIKSPLPDFPGTRGGTLGERTRRNVGTNIQYLSTLPVEKVPLYKQMVRKIDNGEDGLAWLAKTDREAYDDLILARDDHARFHAREGTKLEAEFHTQSWSPRGGPVHEVRKRGFTFMAFFNRIASHAHSNRQLARVLWEEGDTKRAVMHEFAGLRQAAYVMGSIWAVLVAGHIAAGGEWDEVSPERSKRTAEKLFRKVQLHGWTSSKGRTAVREAFRDPSIRLLFQAVAMADISNIKSTSLVSMGQTTAAGYEGISEAAFNEMVPGTLLAEQMTDVGAGMYYMGNLYFGEETYKERKKRERATQRQTRRYIPNLYKAMIYTANEVPGAEDVMRDLGLTPDNPNIFKQRR